MDTWRNRAKRVMREKKITQSDLAEMTGIAQATVSAKLSGNRPTSFDELLEFAKCLLVKPEWLAFGIIESKESDLQSGNVTPEDPVISDLSVLPTATANVWRVKIHAAAEVFKAEQIALESDYKESNDPPLKQRRIG